jgi:predicted transcriptional regulator
MAETTTIRVDRSTRDHLNRLARERHISVAQAASRAVRLLEQEQIGLDLGAPLSTDEIAWLDAEGG